jgi:hypothetical protein
MLKLKINKLMQVAKVGYIFQYFLKKIHPFNLERHINSAEYELRKHRRIFGFICGGLNIFVLFINGNKYFYSIPTLPPTKTVVATPT